MVKKGANEVEINGIFHIKGYPHIIVANTNGTMIGTNLIANSTKIGGGTGIILRPNDIGF